MRKILFRVFYPSDRLKSVLRDFSIFLRQTIECNLNLLYIIGGFLLVSELILLIFPERAFHYHWALIVFLSIDLVLMIILHQIRKEYGRYSYRQLNLLQILIIGNILLLATNLNLASIGKTDYVHPFIIALTFISTGLQLSPVSLTLIILITGTINLAGLFFLQTTPSVFFTCITNISIFVIVAWMLGIMVSRTRVSSFLSNQEVVCQNEILADLTKRDPMTRFFNHESIISHLKQEMRIAQTTQTSLCVLILDVDDFKLVNDTFGHLKGDEALLLLAHQINLSVRKCDIIGRYGGEEFFVIFPNTTLEDARIVSERIRKSIEDAGYSSSNTVTISGGLVLYDNGSVDDLIRSADKRLYIAKRSGKNKIISE